MSNTVPIPLRIYEKTVAKLDALRAEVERLKAENERLEEELKTAKSTVTYAPCPTCADIVKKNLALFAENERLRKLAAQVASQPEEMQAIMRQEGLKIDNFDNPMQKLAFTFYSVLCELANKAECKLANKAEKLLEVEDEQNPDHRLL